MNGPNINNPNTSFVSTQNGNGNVINNKNITTIHQEGSTNAELEELRKRFGKLEDAIKKSSEIGKFDKKDALNDLKIVENNLSKPESQQDKEEISHHWKKTIDIIKDIGQILPVAKSLGQFIGFPIP